MNIEVKRRRESVTQGSADVYIDGKKAVGFYDPICLLKEGDQAYGEIIGGWGSKSPDNEFIMGLLCHPYESIYHYSDLVKTALTSR